MAVSNAQTLVQGAVFDEASQVLTNPGDSSNKAVRVNIVAGAGSGGTASSFGSPFPSTGTAAGFKDNGGNMAGGTLDASGNLLVNVAAGAAGGGIAQTQVRSAGNVWTDVGFAGGDLNMPVQLQSALPAGANTIGKVDQGVGGASAWKIDGSAVTQPVSGTVTANQGGAPWSANITQFGGNSVVTGTGVSGLGIPRVTVSSDSFPATQAVSGTVTANVGTTNGLALDATVSALEVAQASTTSGQKGILSLGAVTTAAPTYTTAQTDPLSLTTAGALRVDGSGVTQPVSGTVTANAGTGPATAWKVDLSSTGANATAVKVDGSAVTQPVSGTVTANQGTANTAANAWPVKLTDGTNTTAVKAASTAAAATDPSAVVQISPNQPQLTIPLNVQGSKTNNNAAPAATNESVLIGVANEALPSYTEGNMIIPAYDLRGVARVVDTPMIALGEYEWQGITGGYTGLAANTPLFSLRWGDATHLCQILRVEVLVFTSTSATVAGITERQLIIARSFTASDTGGTSATLTGNNQKLRTSDATSLVTNLQIGAPLTAGTRTLDAAPIASAIGWSGLLSTGIVIGAYGSSPVGAARSTEGGGAFVKLYDEQAPGARKLVLAQNEGIVVRIGAAQPTSAVNQTAVKIKWREANKIY